MKTRVFAVVITLILSCLFGGPPAFSDQAVTPGPSGAKGYLEVECNYAGVELYACPLDQYERKKTSTFFGLVTNYQESCTGEKLFLGITPLAPVELAAGKYVLLLPENYSWEHEGRIETSVIAGQKTFFLLKLFELYPTRGTGDVSGGSGSGTGGGPGTGPP
jgi:hypothetical protein